MPKKPKTTPPQQPPTVFCGQCRNFLRDTSGPNYTNDTHEYFMGVCTLGCDPDNSYNPLRGTAKIFANKPRHCPNYLSSL